MSHYEFCLNDVSHCCCLKKYFFARWYAPDDMHWLYELGLLAERLCIFAYSCWVSTEQHADCCILVYLCICLCVFVYANELGLAERRVSVFLPIPAGCPLSNKADGSHFINLRHPDIILGLEHQHQYQHQQKYRHPTSSTWDIPTSSSVWAILSFHSPNVRLRSDLTIWM